MPLLLLLASGCGSDTGSRGSPGALGDRVTCDGEYTFDPADIARGANGIVGDAEVRRALTVLYDESDMGDELGPGPFEDGMDAVEYRVLGQDAYREDAWTLKLSLTHASGSDDGVLATYQRYVATMREAGVPPSAEIQRHLARLRS